MKPWYKKWWIWVLGVVAIFVLIGLFSPADDEQATTKSAAHATSRKVTAKKTKSVYKVGETATIDHVQLTVNSVKTAASFDDGLSTPKSGNQYYTVKVTLKNTGKEKASYNPLDFNIKSNGNQTDFNEINTADNNTLDSGDLAAGGTVSGTMSGQAKKRERSS
ncbi:DUF4352 domain-containing protein [Lactiplantibacillus carotarum]|uniref:DUF4352 domain-containing protein n=1 Tax=Lactiplantibacillus carotarum TaxID=2993456 RepID=UPI00298EE25F|nr:DUF4352 domain-containing protein [Lactiplantibacillus carotarum]